MKCLADELVMKAKCDEQSFVEVLRQVEPLLHKMSKKCPKSGIVEKGDIVEDMKLYVWKAVCIYESKSKAKFFTLLFVMLRNYVAGMWQREFNKNKSLGHFVDLYQDEEFGFEDKMNTILFKNDREKLLDKRINVDVIYNDYVKIIKDRLKGTALRVFSEKIDPCKEVILLARKDMLDKKRENITKRANFRVYNRHIAQHLHITVTHVQIIIKHKIEPVVREVLGIKK